MSSITLKPPSSLLLSRHSSHSLAAFSRLLIPSSVSFQRSFSNKRRLSFKIRALDNYTSESNNFNDNNNNNNKNIGNFTNGDSTNSPNESTAKSRKDILLEYVKNVQPEIMELFVKRASPQVVEAMRQTVTNMIGSLPPQFFAVTVTTVAENLAQLMYSVMMTGYMFRNAQFRLELQQSIEQVALPEPQENKDNPDYAPGTQKKVTGEVIRWNNVSGPEKIDAVKYIELLEAEIEELNRQVGRKSTNGQNELLEYMKSLEPQNLKELTSTAGEDVILAMNTFIKRLLAVSDPAQMKTSVSEPSATELGKLLYWLMVVGYAIRNIEVRFDMERVLGTPAKTAELPPGEMI